jgi:hypothetical protein
MVKINTQNYETSFFFLDVIFSANLKDKSQFRCPTVPGVCQILFDWYVQPCTLYMYGHVRDARTDIVRACSRYLFSSNPKKKRCFDFLQFFCNSFRYFFILSLHTPYSIIIIPHYNLINFSYIFIISLPI